MPAFQPVTLFFLVLVLVMISIADFRTLQIPNRFLLVLASLGFGFTWLESSTFPLQSLAGAFLFSGFFWLIRKGHEAWTGRIGLGMGDIKMAAAAGFWIGPSQLPVFMLIASLSALVFLLFASACGLRRLHEKLPFAPFLSLALLLSWIGPETILGGFLL